MTAPPYKQLEQEFRRAHAFRGVISLLRWDAAVMMPRGSSEVRGEQLAALETELHQLLTQPKITRLIDRAQANTQTLDEWQIANVREMRRLRDLAIATPASLVSRLAVATARAEAAWLKARAENSFAVFAPHLEEVLMLVRDKAVLLGQALSLSPYDALVSEFNPGVNSQDIDAAFKQLSRSLPGLIRDAIAQQETRPVLPISGKFPAAKQRALAVETMKALGFPFDIGRLDESEHPFCEGVPGDIRVTTRFVPGDVFYGLFAAIHETGHALYELGLPTPWLGQPVGRDRGMALHESQSLLLEMLIGRSRAFTQWLQPQLARHLGVSGPEWAADNIYAHLTRVRRSLIRVEADEVTYPMHVLLRYELEKRLVAGTLAVKDLPEAWNASVEQRLGAHPRNDIEGCLQDIHWAWGAFGYFPSYALGAMIASQLGEALREEVPDFEEQVARGEFGGIIGWLRGKVHVHGSRLSVQELMQEATGKPLSAGALLRHLEARYLEGALSSAAA